MFDFCTDLLLNYRCCYKDSLLESPASRVSSEEWKINTSFNNWISSHTSFPFYQLRFWRSLRWSLAGAAWCLSLQPRNWPTFLSLGCLSRTHANLLLHIYSTSVSIWCPSPYPLCTEQICATTNFIPTCQKLWQLDLLTKTNLKPVWRQTDSTWTNIAKYNFSIVQHHSTPFTRVTRRI